MPSYKNDIEIIDQVLSHIDNRSTDLGDEIWREPVENYISQARFDAELEVLRRLPVPFCPSASLPEKGSYLARKTAGTPLIAVRGNDGIVRAFRNACRHRGMPLADGNGCAKTLSCPYHAWTYGLDGKLLHVPGGEEFGEINPEGHGLSAVTAEERNGLVFVTQDAPLSDGALDRLPDLLTPDQRVFDVAYFRDKANWKLLKENGMEGYHVKSTHARSFLHYGFDNLNVIETQGRNSRIIFPFKQIEDLRALPREERAIDGKASFVYHLFPNVTVTMQTSITMLVIQEPVSPELTDWFIYFLDSADTKKDGMSEEKVRRLAKFILDRGLKEDRDAACAVQTSLASGANKYFTFGRYEKALGHFHKHLDQHIDKLAAQKRESAVPCDK